MSLLAVAILFKLKGENKKKKKKKKKPKWRPFTLCKLSDFQRK